MTRRVLFHLQHLLGIGHARRGALLARAMMDQGLAVTVLSGGEPIEADWGGAEIIQLPWARALNADFHALVDEHGHALDAAFHARRRELVLAQFERVRPAVLLLETFPFGRRAFRTELTALIAAARSNQPRLPVITSLRDILVSRPMPDWATDVATVVRRDIEAVLVHGDPSLIPLEATFAAAQHITDLLHYTGFVASPPLAAIRAAGTGEVLVSVGGGAVGAALLQAALAARPFTRLADRRWRLIAGPNLPEAVYQTLARELSPGVVLERFRPDFPELLRCCHVSLSQAGYNTILDLLQAGARGLVVPFAAGGENEQTLRAQVLERRGLLQVFPESALGKPIQLAAAIDQAAASTPSRLAAFAFDGARRSAELIATFARKSPWQ